MMKILNQYTTHSSAETSFLLVVYSIAAESRNTCTSTLVVIRVHCKRVNGHFYCMKLGETCCCYVLQRNFPAFFYLLSKTAQVATYVVPTASADVNGNSLVEITLQQMQRYIARCIR